MHGNCVHLRTTKNDYLALLQQNPCYDDRERLLLYNVSLYSLPCFHCFLKTSRLGFKYFGNLLGIGFDVSGIAQLLMAALANAVQGDCHLKLLRMVIVLKGFGSRCICSSSRFYLPS